MGRVKAPLTAEAREAQHEARLGAIVRRHAERVSARESRRIVAIDPGTEESAVVVLTPALRSSTGWEWDGVPPKVDDHAYMANRHLVEVLKTTDEGAVLAIEMVASYGMAVGREVFETVLWAGRMVEAFPGEVRLVYRRDVKLYLCGSMQAKDANVRQALLDRYPRTGGGKTPQVGTKGAPGPLYGISSHAWAALAVGVYAAGVGPKEGEVIKHSEEAQR